MTAAARARGRRGRLGAGARAAGRPARSRSTPSTPPSEPRPTTRPGSSEWRTADRELAARIDALRARPSPVLTPYDVAAAVDAANPPVACSSSGASNPIRDLDLMAGAHPVGERRFVLANRGLAGIDGTLSTRDRGGAGPAARHARDRLRRRRDLPARRNGAGHRARRAAPRPDDRGRQRRRRLDLRHPRAGRAGVRRPLRAALRHPAPRRPGRRLRRDRYAALAGATAAPSSSTPSPAPTAASRSSRPSIGRDDRRALDEQIRALATDADRFRANRVKTATGAPMHDVTMSVDADTFAEFVDALALALDDHDATGEDWRARAALLALPLRPADQVGQRRAAAGRCAVACCSSARRTG